MTELLADGPDCYLWSWTGVWFPFFHCGWVKRFFSSETPWIQFLRIRCWRRRRWTCNNASRYTMRVPNAWRPFSAARHSYRTAQLCSRNWMRWERHWLTGNVGMSTAYWFSILKISWMTMTMTMTRSEKSHTCQWGPGLTGKSVGAMAPPKKICLNGKTCSVGKVQESLCYGQRVLHRSELDVHCRKKTRNEHNLLLCRIIQCHFAIPVTYQWVPE